MKIVDDFLNSITMYKTVLFGLILLVICTFIVSFMGALNFSLLHLFFSLSTLVGVCFASNFLFSKIFKTPVNTESYIITAFILFFLFTPTLDGISSLFPLILVSFIAMASKYILAIKKKHIFNPAAVGAVAVSFLGFGASWWVATPVLFPAILIIGLLVIRKIRKFSLFFAFFAVVTVEMVIFGYMYNTSPQDVLAQLFLSWPFMFFAAVMLTEPLTMPPTRYLQILYGALVGFLFAFQIPLGPIFLSPELSLVIGNIFAYFVSSKQRILLTLDRVEKLSSTLYNYSFLPNEKLDFEPGQYVEWTLPHKNVDIRGNRRFFTIASSPTERDIKLGVRVSEDGSSFKRALLNLKKDEKLSIGNLNGDFTLPQDPNIRLAFLAGGIGITPFRSMIKYLLDKNEERDVSLFHACSNANDFVYDDIFKLAHNKFGLQIHCLLNEKEGAPKDFKGEFGHLSSEMLIRLLPDFKERVFYISGSNVMVDANKKTLKGAGVKNSNIVTDYFSGY